MGRENKKTQIHLDWATVSYRSIMRSTVYLVLLVALGGVFYYLKASLRVSPEESASRQIGRATNLLTDARQTARENPTLSRSVSRSGRLLESAREAMQLKEFVGARAAAEQSIALSRKILDGTSADAYAANVFNFEGDVKIKRARAFVWDRISGSTSLGVGDQIKTARNATAQILYFDGTITTIKPGSLVEIRELSEDPKTKVRKVREKLNWGGVTATTAGGNAAGSFHEVATESATARAMNKAKFEIAYDAKTKTTKAEVHGGKAEVRVAGRTHTLKPLQRMEVTRDRVVTRKIPAAPRLIEPLDSRIFVVSGKKKPVAALRWVEVAEARRYRLQIARTPLFGDRLLDKPDIRSTRVEIPGLRKGTYYWRVAAVKSTRLESPFSETRKFRISGVKERRVADRDPPKLVLKDFLPSGQMVIISGLTEPGALLTVGGQSIDVYDDGEFTAVVRMKREGRNDLVIVAQDPAGNETRMRRTVFVESY